LLPANVPEYQQPSFFLLATLYPLTEAGATGDFGSALRHIRTPDNQNGLDRRVEALLDADDAQLPFRLRQAVRLLASNGVPVDWSRLLNDLLYWTHPERFVQRRWASSYFAG
jgi:CRISPR system Cascade subunit CasB